VAGEAHEVTLEIAGVAPATEAEGPGLRFAVWVQGCSLACPGCCNPQLFERGRGREIDVDALDAEIARAHAQHAIEGVTILGGEPLQQMDAVAELCAKVSRRALGVIVFTGYTLAEAREMAGFDRLWCHLDTLVDGRFEAKQADRTRRVVGSSNQRLVHRTDRYAAEDQWQATGAGRPTAELVLVPGHAACVVGAPLLARRLTTRLANGVTR
jgi:anaerobic ribonucleoside-triphosphate reductase activating protein